MILQIAFGIVLGFLFIFLFIVIIAGFCMLITKLQEDDEIEEIIRPRIRPERTRYEETQHLKKRAQEERPEHWRQK